MLNGLEARLGHCHGRLYQLILRVLWYWLVASAMDRTRCAKHRVITDAVHEPRKICYANIATGLLALKSVNCCSFAIKAPINRFEPEGINGEVIGKSPNSRFHQCGSSGKKAGYDGC